MNGELEREGDRWRLRFSRELAHAPERVWRAVVDPVERKAWFPDTATGDFERVGAALRFQHDDELVEPFSGEVLVVDPPRLLEFTWGDDVIRIEIAPRGQGCTFTLIDTIHELGKAARDGAGWHVCLDKLAHALDGTTPAWSDEQRWLDLNTGYADRFGPEAATIGPPEGWGD